MNGRKILIMEDDRAAVRAMRSELEQAGYEVLVAEDPPEGVAVARSNDPDLYIFDTTFQPYPGSNWDGFTAAEWLHHMCVGLSKPLIFITPDEVEKHRQHAVQVGASAILPKPLQVEQLLAAVHECLPLAQAAA